MEPPDYEPREGYAKSGRAIRAYAVVICFVVFFGIIWWWLL